MNWKDAKKRLDGMNFPTDSHGWKDTHGKETHSKRKKKHNLITSKKYLETIDGFEVEAKYNFCQECNQIRNKALVMFNNQEGVVYEKWFVYHGRKVNKQEDIVNIAKQIFAVLVLLLIS